MHLTDEQLNEYLDDEIQDRTQIELHLSSCDECSARLTVLQNLFDEIESLPELALSRPLTPRITPYAASLPRWLTLTASLQAAMVVVTVIISAPFLMQFVSPYISGLQVPSYAEMFLQLQSGWMAWLDVLSQIQMPRLPEFPVVEVSGLVIVLTLAGVLALWLVGNGLLLRNQIR